MKKSSDLLLIMSNLYSLSNGALKMSPDRMFQTTPLIKLGDQNFKKVNEFLQRFGSIPVWIDSVKFISFSLHFGLILSFFDQNYRVTIHVVSNLP